METITALQPGDVAAYVRAHIIMQTATYAHLARGEFQAMLWDDLDRRVADDGEL